ncbi:hypothetical protein BH10BDE1_BH10BDE1_10070 [soil metagenome]
MFGAMKLKLYHRAGGSALEPRFAAVGLSAGEPVPYFKWQTCLRSLVLVPTDFSDSLISETEDGEWLEDESAYRRLLEIVCGLHSPLVGETEVFGQFKDAVQSHIDSVEASGNSALQIAFASTLRQWAKALIEDVKLVRQKHLLDLGSQSYGSLVRREVRELVKPQIEFLGSGQLATEILPWLMKALKTDEAGAAMVSVHARNLSKARERLEKATSEPIQFFGLEHGPLLRDDAAGVNTRVLIIAAPMSAQDISAWARDLVHYDLIIDLRGESRHDSLAGLGLTKRLRALEEVFSSIENAREIAGVKKNAAMSLIEQRVEVRGATATHRPFGWDDVWS